MIIPYLVFAGKCLEAIDFYESAFGCKAKMCQQYEEYIPEGVRNIPGNLKDWILHAEMDVCGTTLWLADEIQKPVSVGSNIILTVTFPTKKEASDVFSKLSEDADIFLPPTETYYSTFHAGLIDKYGNNWNVVAEEPPSLQ